MKRSTAIAHLVEMAKVASDWLEVSGRERWPLSDMWVTGELLSLADTFERGAVVLTLDLPAKKVPWLAINPEGEWIGHHLGLGKRPLQWCYRPASWPAWTYQNRPVARFWTADGGLDGEAIEALRSRRLDRLEVIEPSAEQLAKQLRKELQISRDHLRTVLDGYWDRDWRKRHKGYDESLEDHLWRAATAVSEMLDVLGELDD